MTVPHRISRCAIASTLPPDWRLPKSQAKARTGPLSGQTMELTRLPCHLLVLPAQPHLPGGSKIFESPHDYRPTRTINTDSGKLLCDAQCRALLCFFAKLALNDVDSETIPFSWDLILFFLCSL